MGTTECRQLRKVTYGKDLKDRAPQLALLAGMPQAPNQYDPYHLLKQRNKAET